jgi:hypothetical protein
MSKRLTEEEYDERIAMCGKVIRIDSYIDSKTKILHMCLIHNEKHLSKPYHILRGQGLSCCKDSPVTEKEYDRRLSIHKKTIRVGTFVNLHTKILHRCLTHGFEGLALPSNLKKGHSLSCCGTKGSNLRIRQEYSKRVDKINRVEVLGEYIDSKTPILHRCKVHNFEGLAAPFNILNGGSLTCCGGKGENLRSKESYKEKIELIGKVKPLEDYVDVNTPIKHRCLTHGYECYAKPSYVLSGGGLTCCGSVGRRWSCKENYVEKVNKIGKVEVLGEYINNSTAILHRCKKHNYMALVTPASILRGKSLLCCKHKTESLLSIIKKNDNRETVVYSHSMANYPEYIKLGISCQIEHRSRDPEYGDMISYWYTSNRLEAYCIEQACLRDIQIHKGYPEGLENPYWPGLSEIVTNEENLAIDVVQYYVDKLEELGPYQFILDFLSPSKKEKEICLEKLKGGS